MSIFRYTYYTYNGILLIIIDNLAVKHNKYITWNLYWLHRSSCYWYIAMTCIAELDSDFFFPAVSYFWDFSFCVGCFRWGLPQVGFDLLITLTRNCANLSACHFFFFLSHIHQLNWSYRNVENNLFPFGLQWRCRNLQTANNRETHGWGF